MKKTTVQLLMENPPEGRRDPQPAPNSTTRTPQPRPAVDARSLTPEDYRRYLAQLGLSLPADTLAANLPMGASPVEDQRARDLSGLAVDRAARARAAEQEQERTARGEEIQPSSFKAMIEDGKGNRVPSSSAEEVRARFAQIGVTDPQLLGGVRDVGRPLEARTQVDSAHAATAQRERDREVARRVHTATQRGQQVDAKKLSAGEFAALMELRGAGGWNPVR